MSYERVRRVPKGVRGRTRGARRWERGAVRYNKACEEERAEDKARMQFQTHWGQTKEV